MTMSYYDTDSLSYYDTDSLSASFPMSRDVIASNIEKGNRDANVRHINSVYGILKWRLRMEPRDCFEKGLKDHDHA